MPQVDKVEDCCIVDILLRKQILVQHDWTPLEGTDLPVAREPRVSGA